MVRSKFQPEKIEPAKPEYKPVHNFSLHACQLKLLWSMRPTTILWSIITILLFHDIFLDRFFNPHPTHLRMTVPVDGSGLMTNLTPRKSLMCRSVWIPLGESFPTRTFETSCGHNAQRRNNRPYKTKQNIALTIIWCRRILTAMKRTYGPY